MEIRKVFIQRSENGEAHMKDAAGRMGLKSWIGGMMAERRANARIMQKKLAAGAFTEKLTDNRAADVRAEGAAVDG